MSNCSNSGTNTDSFHSSSTNIKDRRLKTIDRFIQTQHNPTSENIIRMNSVPPLVSQTIHTNLNKRGMIHYKPSVPTEKSAVYIPDTFFVKSDEAYYVGYWFEGHRWGQGIQVYKSGKMYEGEWHSGSPNGFGRTFYTNGDYHTGTYINGLPEYDGVYLTKEMNEYRGRFVKGLPHGEGEETHQDGFRYVGDFFEGIKEGQGTIFFPGGAEYKGMMKNGAMHGFGSISFSDGRFFTGEWKNGERDKRGVFYWKGVRFEGNYSHGKRNGNGKFEITGGPVIKCSFKGGVLDGHFSITDPKSFDLVSVILNQGKIVEKSIANSTVSSPSGSIIVMRERKEWKQMDQEERNKMLTYLKSTLDSLPSENFTIDAEPIRRSFHSLLEQQE